MTSTIGVPIKLLHEAQVSAERQAPVPLLGGEEGGSGESRNPAADFYSFRATLSLSSSPMELPFAASFSTVCPAMPLRSGPGHTSLTTLRLQPRTT